MTTQRENTEHSNPSLQPSTHSCIMIERIAKLEEAICWVRKSLRTNMIIVSLTFISVAATLILIAMKVLGG